MKGPERAHQREQQPMLGNALPCPRCHATGQVSLMALPGKRTCPDCAGAGWVLMDEGKGDAAPVT